MSGAGLPEGWTIRKSKTHNRHYFFNSETKESIWEPPQGTDIDKLKTYLANDQSAPTKVRASHLLVKHNQSRRPSSWKTEKITISKDEALKIIKGYQNQILSGDKTLEELASTESDCSSSKRGGDLGFFGRGEMQPPFENAAFNLKVGEISDVVSTESGLHLIHRIA